MKEIRTATIEAQAEEGKPMELHGFPIVFDVPTTIHGGDDYTEIIASGALDGADLNDSTLIYGHDQTRVPLARTPKTMQLTITPEGLEMTAQLADTPQAKEVWTAVQRGDLQGMSFAFKAAEDVYDAATNTRTILKIEKVYEVSVVAFPAYPQTSIEARDAMRAGRARYSKIVTKCNSILLHS